MLGELFSIVAPVYVCAGIGFLWVRSGRAYDTGLMTDLIFYIGAPSLVFSSLVSQSIGRESLETMFLAVVVAYAVLASMAAIVLRLTGQTLRTFLAPMTFGNAGNMGLPLCYFAFGSPGLELGICFFVVGTLAHFTIGQAAWSGRPAWGAIFRSPVVWSVSLAFLFLGFQVDVPRWLLRTTGLLGDFTIPIMQLTLGVSLAGFRLRHVGRSVGLSVLKIAGGAAVGAGVASVLGLEGVARGVLILQCAMPVAVFNYMFAVRFDQEPDEVASVIVASTLMAALALPILIGLLVPAVMPG